MVKGKSTVIPTSQRAPGRPGAVGKSKGRAKEGADWAPVDVSLDETSGGFPRQHSQSQVSPALDHS